MCLLKAHRSKRVPAERREKQKKKRIGEIETPTVNGKL
jgi:hypothetical protein